MSQPLSLGIVATDIFNISKNNRMHSKHPEYQMHTMRESKSRIRMQSWYHTTPQMQADTAPNSQDPLDAASTWSPFTWYWFLLLIDLTIRTGLSNTLARIRTNLFYRVKYCQIAEDLLLLYIWKRLLGWIILIAELRSYIINIRHTRTNPLGLIHIVTDFHFAILLFPVTTLYNIATI